MAQRSIASDEELPPWEQPIEPVEVEGSLAPWESAPQTHAGETAFGGVEIPYEAEAVPGVGALPRMGMLNVPKPSMKKMGEWYPKYQWEISSKGNIVARDPEAGKVYRLDPNSMELMDITDIAPDIPLGMMEGAMTTTGALAGGLPGAMGASAVGGVASDLIRQGVGNIFGLQEGYDPGSTVESGIISAAMPVGFGGGATKKQAMQAVLKKAPELEGQELIKATEKKLASQRGALGQVWDTVMGDWVGPTIAPGRPRNLIKKTAENLDLLDAARNDPTGEVRVKHILDFQENVKKKLPEKLRESGKELQKYKDDFDRVAYQPLPDGGYIPAFNTDDYLSPFEDAVQKIRRISPNSEDAKSDLQKAIVALNNDVYSQSKFMDMNQIHERIKHFRRKADEYGAKFQKGAQAPTQGMTNSYDAILAGAYLDAANQMRADMEAKAIQYLGPEKGKRLANIFESNAAIQELQDQLASKFQEPKGALAFLKKILSPDGSTEQYQAGKLISLLGIDPYDAARTEQMFHIYLDPGWMPKSISGTTSTSRSQLGGAVGAAGGMRLGKAMQVDPLLTAALGAAAGNIATSDAFALNIMKGNRFMRKRLPESLFGTTKGVPTYLQYIMKPEAWDLANELYGEE